MKTPRKLLLLRHAKSSWDDPGLEDRDRPLAERGRKAARVMAKFLAQQKLRPALALVSTALRTRATWERIEAKLEGVPVSFEDGLYEAGRSELLARLRRLDDRVGSVLLIGHNPGLGRLAESLVGHRGEPEALERMALKFATGALAEIDLDIARWNELEDGRGRLIRFIRPKDLAE